MAWTTAHWQSLYSKAQIRKQRVPMCLTAVQWQHPQYSVITLTTRFIKDLLNIRKIYQKRNIKEKTGNININQFTFDLVAERRRNNVVSILMTT